MYGNSPRNALYLLCDHDSPRRETPYFGVRMNSLRWLNIASSTARALLIASAAIAVFGLLLAGDNVAHGAHLGGMLAGFVFIRWGGNLQVSLSNWRPRQARQRKHELVRAAIVRGRPWRTAPAAADAELPPEEFISREVDPILDKISAHGIQSLTERERKTLEAARKKMTKH